MVIPEGKGAPESRSGRSVLKVDGEVGLKEERKRKAKGGEDKANDHDSQHFPSIAQCPLPLFQIIFDPLSPFSPRGRDSGR